MRPGSRADGGPTQRQFSQVATGVFNSFDAVSGLAGIPAKNLSQRDRRRVLKVRAPDLKDAAEPPRLPGQLDLQLAEIRQQHPMDQNQRAEVQNSWNNVVA